MLRIIQGDSIMTVISIATSIVLGLAATTSAFAAEPEAAPAATAPQAVATTAASSLPVIVTLAAGPAALAYKASPKTRYCFRVARTGSLLTPKVCNTRADWEAEGVDLDAALAGR
jgi:hypothetical protein